MLGRHRHLGEAIALQVLGLRRTSGGGQRSWAMLGRHTHLGEAITLQVQRLRQTRCGGSGEDWSEALLGALTYGECTHLLGGTTWLEDGVCEAALRFVALVKG